MEAKKNKQKDIEQLRLPLLFLGGFITGSIVLMSFTYKLEVSNHKTENWTQQKDIIPTQYVVKEEIIENKTPPKVVEIKTPITAPTASTPTKENIDVDETTKIQIDPIIVEPDPIVEPIAPIVDYPDKEATFPGGVVAMKKYLSEHVNYPEIALTLGDQGRVFVEFVVNKDGSIEQVKILRGVSPEIDKEAKKVVREMPKWQPAESNGEYVRARCRIPINFILQ